MCSSRIWNSETTSSTGPRNQHSEVMSVGAFHCGGRALPDMIVVDSCLLLARRGQLTGVLQRSDPPALLRTLTPLAFPLFKVGDEPVASRGRPTELHRLRKAVLTHIAPYPHVTHATVTPLHLTDRQIANVIRDPDAMAKRCLFKLAHAAE